MNLELTKSMRWGDIFELVKSSFMSIDRRDDFSAILNISEYKLQGIMTWNDLTAVDSTFDTAFNSSTGGTGYRKKRVRRWRELGVVQAGASRERDDGAN